MDIKGVKEMKAVIERTNDFKNYVVTTEDKQVFIVKDIDEAIKLKEKLENENQ